MSILTLELINNAVGMPVGELAFNRAHSNDDQVLVLNVEHSNGDVEGFCLPLEAVKPLLRALKEIAKHPAVK